MTDVLPHPSAPTRQPPEQSEHDPPAEARVDPLAVQEGIVCRRCWQVAPAGDPARCATCGAARPEGGWAAMPFALNDRYHFHKLLGRGAMGAVFIGVDQTAPLDDRGRALARAVKVGQRVDRANLAVQRARFEHEAAAAGLLGRAPAFVRTFGYDTGHEPYLVMELVKWPTLAKVLRAGRLSSVQAARLGVALLEALEIMHFYRMVHRDLKPSNLFVDERDGLWRVKIADLGIWIRDHDARAPASMATDDRVIHGTIPYMSPEQMAGNTTVGARSDLHAVASILWECVTGAVPYPATGATPLEQVQRRRGAVQAPLSCPAGMTPALFAALAEALCPSPDDRYRHCRAMIAALRAVVNQGQAGQGWIQGAQTELAALRDRLAAVDRVRLDAAARETAASIERGLDMLGAYLARPGAGHDAARRLIGTVRRDLMAVVEAADDPYVQAEAADPTAPTPGAATALPPTAAMAPTVETSSPTAEAAAAAEALAAAEPLPPTSPMGNQPPPADPIERYDVIELIGAGSTARVFAATQTALDRRIALRVMHPEGVTRLGVTDGAGFFEARARAAARIWHPNVAPVYDFGVGADGLPYRAGPLLGGVDLLTRLKQTRVLDPTDVVALGQALASALAAAHDVGVVHLNVKPDRVVLMPRAGLPDAPALFGFGFALDDIERLLGGGRRYGTPAYMAPEQFDGVYGPPTDVYNLGIVLFRLTTGLLPFWGQTVDQVVAAKREAAPELPRVNARQQPVSDRLRQTVARMLSTAAADRPSARAVAEALSAG